MATVTATSLTVLADVGLVTDVDVLNKKGRYHYARLAGLLIPPANGTIAAVLAYEHADGRLVQFSQATIHVADGSGIPRQSKAESIEVDVSKYAQLHELLVLRVLARVTSGTGYLSMPTVLLRSE